MIFFWQTFNFLKRGDEVGFFYLQKKLYIFFLQKSFFIEKCITFAVRIRKKTDDDMKYIHFAYPFYFYFYFEK